VADATQRPVSAAADEGTAADRERADVSPCEKCARGSGRLSAVFGSNAAGSTAASRARTRSSPGLARHNGRYPNQIADHAAGCLTCRSTPLLTGKNKQEAILDVGV